MFSLIWKTLKPVRYVRAARKRKPWDEEGLKRINTDKTINIYILTQDACLFRGEYEMIVGKLE